MGFSPKDVISLLSCRAHRGLSIELSSSLLSLLVEEIFTLLLRKQMPYLGFDPLTFGTEVRGSSSELPSHLEEDALLLLIETESLSSDVGISVELFGSISLVTKAPL